MSTKVTASLVVQFQSDSTGSGDGLTLEIDDREDGYNKGETSFRPGDTVYYLLYKADDVTLDTHFVSAGGKRSVGSGAREVDEVLTFTDSNEASLQYPASSAVELTWIGATLGSAGSMSVESQQTVRLANKVVGLLRAQYSADYTAFALSGVPLTYEQALIYVAGTRP